MKAVKAVTLIGSWFMIGLLATGLSMTAQAQETSIQARDTLNQGVAAFRNGDYQSAIELFKQAVQIDPGFTTAELYLASAYSQSFLPGGESSKNLAFAENAIDSYKRVLSQDPNNTTALFGLATMYQSTNKLQDARDAFLAASRSAPQNPLPFYSVGAIDWIIVYDKKNPLPSGRQTLLIDEGLSNLDSALALNPRYEDAMTYKNLLLREKARLAFDPQEKTRLTAQADDWFNRALETRKARIEQGGPASGTAAGAIPPPPPPPQPVTPVRVASTLAAETLIRQVPPVYPQAARDNRIQGMVVLEAKINKDGFVDNLKMISGHPLLAQAAIDAVRQWTYKPLLVDGQPVDFVTTVTVNFALAQ
jgi:TonB family protein